MRTEFIRGCGVILNRHELATGQIWAAADGSNHTVRIKAVDKGWVSYTWEPNGRHEKDWFSSQCRYCLVLESADIPKELLK